MGGGRWGVRQTLRGARLKLRPTAPGTPACALFPIKSKKYVLYHALPLFNHAANIFA